MQNLGARYGIWGENPYGPDIATEALGVGQGISKLINEYYKNLEAREAAKYAQQTGQGKIDLENLKNATDMQYFPLNAAAGLGKTRAEIDELGARSNLYGIQGREAQARAGLMGAQTDRERAMLGLTGSMGQAGFIPDGFGGWVKDPRMGSNRSGAGGTYVDPQTGAAISTDTNNQASRDQRAIAGINNVTSYLNEAMKKLPQFQTAGKKGEVMLKGLSNAFLGTNYPEPSQLASGKAAILESAEGFINAFGLNATNENVSKAAQIMSPRFGESAEGYRSRVAEQLSDFMKQQQRAEGRLRQGTPVGSYAAQPEQAASPAQNNADPLGIR